MTAFSQKPMLGTLIDHSHPLSKWLLGSWLFNEGSGDRVRDSSGHFSDYLGLMTDVGWGLGTMGRTITFSGTAGNSVRLRIWNGGPHVTIVARVLFEQATGSDEQIIAADSNTSGLRTFQLKRNTDGKLNFIVFVGDVDKQAVSDTVLTTDKWWDVAAVNDGVNCFVYVNEVQDGAPVASGDMDLDAAALGIGARFRETTWAGATEELQGKIEYLHYFSEASTSSEIAQIHRDPYAMFRRPSVFAPAAVGGGLGVPLAMHHYKMMRAS